MMIAKEEKKMFGVGKEEMSSVTQRKAEQAKETAFQRPCNGSLPSNPQRGEQGWSWMTKSINQSHSKSINRRWSQRFGGGSGH